ncbi:MAG: hypothetical protein SF069_00620 [Phycisphaerae bacterium]|nr:hypothetical protein [Phycisphaerae bacterium]
MRHNKAWAISGCVAILSLLAADVRAFGELPRNVAVSSRNERGEARGGAPKCKQICEQCRTARDAGKTCDHESSSSGGLQSQPLPFAAMSASGGRYVLSHSSDSRDGAAGLQSAGWHRLPHESTSRIRRALTPQRTESPRDPSIGLTLRPTAPPAR